MRPPRRGLAKCDAGVWVDHRKAVVVSLAPGGEHLAIIVSRVEKHAIRSGDSPLKGRYESQQVAADDRRQRALTGEFNIYYDTVIAALRGAGSIVIFGPGEAKGELKKRLIKHKLGKRIAAIATADKMTDRQIAAKVRDHYAAGVANAGTPRA